MKYDPIMQLKYLININKDTEVILRDLFGNLKFSVGSMMHTSMITHTKYAEKVENNLIYDAVCVIDDDRLVAPIYLSFERKDCYDQYSLRYVCLKTENGFCYFDNLVSRTDEDGDTVLDYRFSFYDNTAKDAARDVATKLSKQKLNVILLPVNYEEYGIIPDLSYRTEGFWNPDLDESPILEGYKAVNENINNQNNSRKRNK
ncbi:MAG: hypothetical protein J5634_04635 [Bacilli bacterium]|nr:hypothetical protein [Bacilli bacterium]